MKSEPTTIEKTKGIIRNEYKAFESSIPKNISLQVKDIVDQIEHQFKFSKNAEKLAKCTPASLAACIKACCQLGLEPGWGANAPDVYFIPYASEAKPELSYVGLMKLARRSGYFRTIYAKCVYEQDSFEAWADENGQSFKHGINGFGGRDRTDNIVGVYAVAQTTNGETVIETMSREEVEYTESTTRKVPNMSPAWQKWWGEMAKKTVIKRLLKTLPQSKDMSMAESFDNEDKIIDVTPQDQKIAQLKTAQDVMG